MWACQIVKACCRECQSDIPASLRWRSAPSLFVAPGVQLIDTEGFPAAYKPGALAAREALARIRTESNLDWSFLSPPALLAAGERTGNYRVGGDDLLMKGKEPAGITVGDLAVAIADCVIRA